MPFSQCQLECVRDHVRRLVNVPQPMSLVDDNEIPRCCGDVRFAFASKLVGADDDGIRGFKRAKGSLFDCGFIGLRLEYPAR